MIKVTYQTILDLDQHHNCVCIMCKGCGNRGTVHKAVLLESPVGKRYGTDTQIKACSFRCSKCGGNRFDLFLIEAEGFQHWYLHGLAPREVERPLPPPRPWPHHIFAAKKDEGS